MLILAIILLKYLEMLFNSFEFLIFMILVFSLYWAIGKERIKSQNILLLLASYIFYGWWDWRFLSLIFISSIADYSIGLAIERAHSQEGSKADKAFSKDPFASPKTLLYLSLFINLGILGFFKYFNFFIDSFSSLVSSIGLNPHLATLNIILPVGISFYTFQTLSYSIDVYKKKIPACKDPIAFFAFVSFFPQLVAGPIEKAHNLLEQFMVKRNFDYSKAREGSQQILWGLFKKIVIADNCATIVNEVFTNYESLPMSSLLLGCIYFSCQIYGDFSGYSDIAIGAAKLFGFRLMTNFKFPYFSRDVAEFWRRWHISLSSWFRDYVYIPLGGSQVSTAKQIRNIFIVFVVSGFWHGANWTFVVWGLLNAIYFVPLMLASKNRQHLDTVAAAGFLPSSKEFIKIISTFVLISITWVFFRAENLGHAMSFFAALAKPSLEFNEAHLMLLPAIIGFFSFEWCFRDQDFALQSLKNKYLRLAVYSVLILLILSYGSKSEDFIYFQF